MKDDIVTRLRRFDEGEILCGFVRDFDGGKRFYGLCREASDEIERLRSLWSEQKSQAMTLFDENRILRKEIASLRKTIERSHQVSIEWIRATQERARMIEGKLE